MDTKTNLCKDVWLEEKLDSPNLDERTMANELLKVRVLITDFVKQVHESETSILPNKPFLALEEYIDGYER